MKVILNSEEVEIFKGARVEDLIRNSDPENLKKIKNGELSVTDKFKNIVQLEGELTEGSVINVSERKRCKK